MNQQTAFVDFFGVTFRAAEAGTNIRAFLESLVRNWFGVEAQLSDTGRGKFGYAVCLEIQGIGLAAYGGNENTLHLSITGDGCKAVKDWRDVIDTIEDYRGKLTRVDVAADDFKGETFNLAWCKEQYESRQGFKPSRGTHPNAKLMDDMGSGKGCTFYVGSRESGKLFRGYEKGKEQGDPNSPWFRVEVEYRAVHRELSPQMLRDPGAYLAGAYPCLEKIAVEQSAPLTVAYTSAAAIERTIEHAQKQAGRALHMLLTLNGGDITGALSRIYRPELPKRLIGKVRALVSWRESEAATTDVMPPAWARDAKPAECIALDKAFKLETRAWRRGFQEHNPITGTAAPVWEPTVAA